MKVLVADSLHEEGLKILREHAEVDVLTDLTPKELVEQIKDYDAMVVRSGTQVTREVIGAAPRLQVIARAGSGVDNIDVDAATQQGVLVVNTPGGNTISAAEHTLALLLSLARNVPQADRSTRRGEWKRGRFTGVEVTGKTLGVVGLGRVGGEVARRARCLGMDVVAYDPYVSKEKAAEMGAVLTSLDEVLGRADFLTLHTPLTPATRGLIDAEKISLMKPGAHIVNAARGGIIDEEALYEALQEDRLGGAALDVFETEPPGDSPLFALDNVVVTPHLGASTREAQSNVAVMAAEQVLAALRGEPVRFAVNLPGVGPEVASAIQPYLCLSEKIGRFAGQTLEGQLQEISLQYSGPLTQWNTQLLTHSALKGLLEPVSEQVVNIVNAPKLARERGIRVVESTSETAEDFHNLIALKTTTGEGEHEVIGTTFGRGDPRIVYVDGYRVDAVPEGHMLVTRHRDVPGMIGQVGAIMGQHGINIAGMQVGRHEIGGEAIMMLNLDDPVPEEVLKQVRRVEGIKDARVIHL